MPVHLIWRNLRAHWVRSFLTMGSIAIAVFLVILLRTFLTSLTAGIDLASSKRLIAQSAVSLFVGLPRSYQSKIESIEGVEHVSKWNWFGGRYGEDESFFAQFGVDAETLMKLYPEMRIVDGKYEDFETKRNACVVGKGLVDRFGWKVGETVKIQGTIYTMANWRDPWEFDVVAVYDSDAPNVDNTLLFFRYDYLENSLESGAAEGPMSEVGVYVIGLEDGANAERVMRDIDERFADGSQAVQATTEAEFNRQFVTMLGNIPTFLGSIGAGVLFAILFAAINTMLMAGRERTRDLGIMKALGFKDWTAFGLLMGESLLLCGLGGGLGIALAVGIEGGLKRAFAQFAPTYHATSETIMIAAFISVGVGLIAGAIPAWRASKLRTIEALRRGA